MTFLPRPARRGWLIAAALLAAVAPAAEPAPGRVLPLAVRDGRCECVLPTARADDKYLLVVGALGRASGPYRVHIRTEATEDAVSLPVEDAPPDDAWRRRTADLAARQAQARKDRPPFDEYPAADQPPPRRVFHLFVRGRDFHDPDGYVDVPADLRATGRRCQVYVDHAFPHPESLQPTIDDAVHTFDEAVYPEARRRLGRCLDVDRDGRFTLFFSGRLDRLAGNAALSGFVRSADFYRDLAAPFGNRADMMYLNTDLLPGPYLRTVLAHEYTHAVVCSEHVFGDYLPGVVRQDEESWLGEALAHAAEDLHGFSRANLDYRVSAYLSDPSRYPLVEADYYAAGLWRTHGCRGATYLFLRRCVERDGPDLLARLVQSNLAGTANLEAATGKPFAELFRDWTTATALSADLHGPYGGRLLCGPRFRQVALDGGRADVDLAGTSAAYVLLHSPVGAEAVADDRYGRRGGGIASEPDPAAGRDGARLTLRREPGSRPGVCRLELTAHDGEVTLEDAAWERRTPLVNRPEDTSWRPDRRRESRADVVRIDTAEGGRDADQRRHSCCRKTPTGSRCCSRCSGAMRTAGRWRLGGRLNDQFNLFKATEGLLGRHEISCRTLLPWSRRPPGNHRATCRPSLVLWQGTRRIWIGPILEASVSRLQSSGVRANVTVRVKPSVCRFTPPRMRTSCWRTSLSGAASPPCGGTTKTRTRQPGRGHALPSWLSGSSVTVMAENPFGIGMATMSSSVTGWSSARDAPHRLTLEAVKRGEGLGRLITL